MRRVIKATLVLLAAFVLQACTSGSGASGSKITGFVPSTFDSEESSLFIVSGENFGPIGTKATVRFVAATGTPFLGGTVASVETTASVDSSGRITGMTPLGGVVDTANATILVEFNNGSRVQSIAPFAHFDGPEVLGCTPDTIAPDRSEMLTLHGTGYGPIGDTVTVHFDAGILTPFAGGTASQFETVGTIIDGTRIWCQSPFCVGWIPAQVVMRIEFDTGSVTEGAIVNIEPAGRQILGSDPTAHDVFGSAVDVDGDYAVVGAPQEDVGHENDGAVYVYKRIGTTWTLEKRLTSPNAHAFGRFGLSVAIEGNTVVVGTDENALAAGSGAAYVFTRDHFGWAHRQQLLPAGGTAHDHFGSSVAISGDTIVVGAFNDDADGDEAGSAYVFRGVGDVWTQEARLQATDAEDWLLFGSDVDLQGDRAVIGAPARFDEPVTGRAYVFDRVGTLWTQTARIADAGVGDRFGASVALDASTLVVGADYESSATFDHVGAVYVFELLGTSWTRTARLLSAAPQELRRMGSDVAVQGDTMMVSERAHIDVYVRTGSGWTHLVQLTVTDAHDSFLGNAIAFDGITLIGGAYSYDHGDEDSAGAAYLW